MLSFPSLSPFRQTHDRLLNRGITGYFVIAGLCHATTMLGDNLRGTDGNSNAEHLYGDVAGWYFIAGVHLILGPWSEWLSTTTIANTQCA
jgi:hypothetical protein